MNQPTRSDLRKAFVTVHKHDSIGLNYHMECRANRDSGICGAFMTFATPLAAHGQRQSLSPLPNR